MTSVDSLQNIFYSYINGRWVTNGYKDPITVSCKNDKHCNIYVLSTLKYRLMNRIDIYLPMFSMPYYKYYSLDLHDNNLFDKLEDIATKHKFVTR